MAPAPILRLRGGSADARTASTAAYCGVPISARNYRVVAGCEAGCMRFHLQRALQQIGLERGDRPLVDWGGHRATESRPTVTTRWAMRTTTHCARASSRPWSANCWIGAAFAATPRPAWRSSSSLRASTIGAGATRCWATSRRSRSRTTRGRRLHEHTGSGVFTGPNAVITAPLRGPRAGRHANGPHSGPLRSLSPERGTLRDPLR